MYCPRLPPFSPDPSNKDTQAGSSKHETHDRDDAKTYIQIIAALDGIFLSAVIEDPPAEKKNLLVTARLFPFWP